MKGYPNRWIVYDTETRSTRVPGPTERNDLTFRLGVAYFADPVGGDVVPENWLYFTDPEVFFWHIDRMERADDPIWIFAHNHGFDARIVGFFRKLGTERYSLLPPPGTKEGWRYREPLFVGETPPFIMRLWRPDGQQLILSDTFQWVYHSLGWCGERLKSPKGTLPRSDCSESDLFSYCKQDVVILRQTLAEVWRFCRVLGIKDWQPTVASQAYHSWRCRYENGRIKRSTAVADYALDRAAYYGGRVDCFRLGRIEGTIVQVDVNSLYPFMMMKYPYPVEAIDHGLEKEASQEAISAWAPTATAEVFLDSPHTGYPVRHRNGTWYVCGKVRTILCGPELEAAVRRGHVRRIGRYVTYRTERIFEKWVEDLWSRRRSYARSGNEFNAHLCKLMMNSLAGKFGQRTGKWVHHDDGFDRHAFGSGVVVSDNPADDVQFRILAGSCYYRHRHEEDPRGFVPIAAWITSYARLFMDSIRNLARSDGVFYQATDSLLVDQRTFDRMHSERLIDPDDIGCFKVEGCYQWVEIRGQNNLTLQGTPRVAGVKLGSRQVEPGLWETEAWQTLDQSICQGSVSSVSVRKTYRRCPGSYSGQRVLPDGHTTPWLISNWHVSPTEQRLQPLALER